MKHYLKRIFLASLGGIVSRPILGVRPANRFSHTDRFRDLGRPVNKRLTLKDVLNGEDMLALLPVKVMVRARTYSRLPAKQNRIASGARLGWNPPDPVFSYDATPGRYLKSSLLSLSHHSLFSCPVFTTSIYYKALDVSSPFVYTLSKSTPKGARNG